MNDQGDRELLGRFEDAYRKLRGEIARVIVGQEEIVDQLLIAIFSQGHCILEGVPGLAKTLMVSTLASLLTLSLLLTLVM